MAHRIRLIPILCIAFVLQCLASCGGSKTQPEQPRQVDDAARHQQTPTNAASEMEFKLTTPAFEPDGPIPRKYSGEGEDISPEFTWGGVPPGTKEFALVCDDPDARSKNPWVHWVIYGIGPDVRTLPENLKSGVGELTEPIVAKQGENFFDKGNTVGWRGPMPPVGRGTHHYHFKLYALDTRLDLPPGATKPQLLEAIKGHVLGEAEIIGTYERK